MWTRLFVGYYWLTNIWAVVKLHVPFSKIYEPIHWFFCLSNLILLLLFSDSCIKSLNWKEQLYQHRNISFDLSNTNEILKLKLCTYVFHFKIFHIFNVTTFFFPRIAEHFNVIINGNKKVKDHQICIFESREAIRVATDTLVLREMSISKK